MMHKKRGFTLIELLVVIGVLAVIAAGVVALINPVEKTRQANDAKVQSDVGQFVTAIQSFAAQQNDGSFPCSTGNANSTICPNPQNMMPYPFTAIGPSGSQELATLPNPPTGGAYYYFASGGNRPIAGFVVYGRLISGKYNSGSCSNQQAYWVYDSRNGRICGVCQGAAPAGYPNQAVTCTF